MKEKGFWEGVQAAMPTALGYVSIGLACGIIGAPYVTPSSYHEQTLPLCLDAQSASAATGSSPSGEHRSGVVPRSRDPPSTPDTQPITPATNTLDVLAKDAAESPPRTHLKGTRTGPQGSVLGPHGAPSRYGPPPLGAHVLDA